MLNWSKLLTEDRFADLLGRREAKGKPDMPDFSKGQFRLPQERDHDRILFSTPFRRLGDKTQVFPLESIESIRTRLTHSYEVANLARSLGVEIASSLLKNHKEDLKDLEVATKDPIEKFHERIIRVIPSTLATVGLAHDIGNPPFGHQGEFAIRSWFGRNKKCLWGEETESGLSKQHENDFLNFEGNAQTLRVVTKLQVKGDDLGLNLTLGTLAALMKYVAASDEVDDSIPTRKKVGFFASEQSLVERVRNETGLMGDALHPLAMVMEACDDIAYSVLDIEDAIKKGVASLNDLLAYLECSVTSDAGKEDTVIKYLLCRVDWEIKQLKLQQLHPSELQDVATQMFRVHAIHLMVCAVAKTFETNYENIMSGEAVSSLVEKSGASNLYKLLKTFSKENAFSHKSVLEVELSGYNTINRLMDYLWIGITDRESYEALASKRKSPFSSYAYSRISKNYRRIFEGKVDACHKDGVLPIRYREMQLLTDMISGMTDQFCIDLHDDLAKHFREWRVIDGSAA